MAQSCDICGRSPLVGFNVSHAHNKTKMRQQPNLRVVRLAHSGNNKVTLRVCADDLKTLKNKGLLMRWKDLPENQKPVVEAQEAPKSLKPKKLTPKAKKAKAAKKAAIPAA